VRIAKKNKISAAKSAVQILYRDINLTTASLLLTGQITINGLNILPGGGFTIPLSGPIFGGTRVEGRSGSRAATAAIDVIDIIIAGLLIARKISVRSVFVTSGRFSITVTGPPFGAPLTIPDMSKQKQFQQLFRRYMKV
jgi:hypothetical protein